jgi:ribosomal protein L20
VALNTIKQTNVEIDRHVITEILLKVALNTIKQTNVEIDRLKYSCIQIIHDK